MEIGQNRQRAGKKKEGVSALSVPILLRALPKEKRPTGHNIQRGVNNGGGANFNLQ